jgi:tetratricopeptide (TPR) repeat protein
VRALQFAVALSIGVAVPLCAQQLGGPQQPTERLLILPFMASPADSAASIALADAVRDRVNALVKSKVMVVPKTKLCEALAQSGFSCNGLLDDQQAKQLARFLQVHSYVTGAFAKSGSNLTADVQMIDIGSSGMSGRFIATNGNPGTTAALAETIAQRIASIVRISESIRNCNDERKKGNFSRARSEAQKALTVDPNSAGAWLCISTIYEAQRMPPDSLIAANLRALKSDSLNGTALENLAHAYMVKNDTLKAMEAYVQQLKGEPRNTQRRLGVVQQYRQMKEYTRAVAVLDDGLKVQPGEAQLIDMKLTICTEANNYRCASEMWVAKSTIDSMLLKDTTNLKPAIGAAQQASDTSALDLFTAAAYRHFPNNVSYIKARAGAFELAGKTDSAMAYYKKALALEPNDAATSLQIAKEIVDRVTYDTAQARRLREAKDTAGLRNLQQAFAAKVDSAKPFLKPGLASSDSTQRLAADVIMLTAGSKVAQAAAYPAAYQWLDSLLSIIGYTPRTAADTIGPKHQVRINASFWYGLSSILTLQPSYKAMSEAKGNARCPMARAVFDRLSRTKDALQLGRRVHPPTVDQMLGFVAQYEKAKSNVQGAFKCKPPL